MSKDTWFVNGLIINPSDEQDSLNGRGLAYGDGLFETMRAIDGQVPLIELHTQRLSEGCGRLGINLDIQACIEQVQQSINLRSDEDKSLQMIVKLIVSRGGAAQGYEYDHNAEPNICIRTRPLLGEDKQVTHKNAQLCKTRLAIQPMLAGIKHLNRLEQVLAAAELASSSDEGILLNMSGQVVEAISSNLIAVIDGELFFPDLSQSGVKGVMQTWLHGIANQCSIPHQVSAFDLEQLLSSSEILLTNSVRGIRNLSSITLNDDFESTENWQARSTEFGDQMRSLIETKLHKDFFSF